MRRSWFYSGIGSFLVALTLLLTIFFPLFDPKNSFASASSGTFGNTATGTSGTSLEGQAVSGGYKLYTGDSGSYTLDKIVAYVYETGLGNYDGTVTAAIFQYVDHTNPGEGGSVAGTKYDEESNASVSVNGYTWITVSFATPYTMTGGTWYYLVLYATADAGSTFSLEYSSGLGGYGWYDNDDAPEFSSPYADEDTTSLYNYSIYGVYTSVGASWVNRAPTVSNWGPANQTKNILLYNQTNALIWDDDGNDTDVTFWYGTPINTTTTPTGWVNAQVNNSFGHNTTVRDLNSSWIKTYGQVYWWKITAKDTSGSNSTNGTKWFRTRYHNVTNSPSANNTPANAATGQELNPRLTLYTNETITKGYNATFRTNATGTWTTIGTNTSVTNGTHRWTPTTMCAYNHKYWWSVNSTGFASKTWDNDTYSFTTKNTAPTAASPSPSNDSTSTATPKTAITVNTGGDGHSLTVTFFNNSSAAPTTWTNYGHNNSVGNGTYRHTASFATDGGTTYYWKVTVNDGVVNITYWYKFTVSALSVSNPFPLNNSLSVLTGIGNMSVIINSAGAWNISLRDNATYTLQAYASGASSSDAVQYCDVNDALYFQFNQNYTWYVNATDGAESWDNHTFYFTTFNGSGFIYLDNTTINTETNLSTGVAIDPVNKYIYVVDNVSKTLSSYTYKNSTLEFLNDADLKAPADTCDVYAVLRVAVGQYIHVLEVVDLDGLYQLRYISYSFDGTTLTYINHIVLQTGYTKCPDIAVVDNGTSDRLFATIIKGSAQVIICYNFDGSDYVYTDKYPASGSKLYSKLSAINTVETYLCAVNDTTHDIELFIYNESGDYDFNYKDVYEGTYNDVTNDGHYFYGVSDTSLDIFSVNENGTDKLWKKYSYIDSGMSVCSVGDNSFIGSSDGDILSYLFEGGEFIEQQTEEMVNNSKSIYEMDGQGSYLVIAGEEGGLHLYGYELLHVAPPVIDLVIAGDPSKDSVDRDGTIRYVNQSYNNQTFVNITAHITVPDYRTIGRYFRTIDDTLLVATGNLSDSDHVTYANETNQTFLASKYPCTFTGDYSQVSAFISFAGHGLAKIAYAIYSDNAGEPDSLLGFTEYKTPGESSGASYEPDVNHVWYTLNISYDADGNPVDYITLNQGTDYWLVVATNDTSQYIEDIYWVLGNSLGDTSYVRNATYTIGGDMNFSNITSLDWSTDATEDAHYLCIYAIANSTYNDNINMVDITSATVQFYNGTWEEHDMTSYGDNLWTVNLTGLVDDSIWHTFNITAYDELNDEVTYNHYRLLYQGWENGWDAENIEFKTGVPTVHESDHLGYDSSNVSTDLYNSSYVLYLYEHFYDDTPDLFGDGEHNEHALPHEQGVDGGANDTGRWVNQLPDDDLQQRYCYDFSGGFWDANISIEDTLTLNNVYLHWWIGASGHTGGTNSTTGLDNPDEWNRDAIDFGRSNTTYDPSWLDDIGGDYYMGNFGINDSTRDTSIITGKDIDTNDFTERLITRYYNMTDVLGSTVFDGSSIYQFFIGHADNQSGYEWGYSSAIYNNRSYLSYILFNIPHGVLDGTDTRDSDNDGLSDHYELNTSFTHPFLKDTDGDGYDDNIDDEPNDYLLWESEWGVIDSDINGSIYNQTSVWSVINSSLNGSFYNTTNWIIINNSLNGSIYNLTHWIVLDSAVNGSLYNLSVWSILNDTINGTIWNQTISWKIITSDINGTIYNNTGIWTVISSSMNGSIYNITSWITINNSINGTISNTSWVWQAFSTTLNGTIYNNTGAWTVLSSSLNGSIYNRSATWSILSSTLNGSIYNTSIWDAFNTSLNGSIYNNTGVWHDFYLKLNGSIYNTSRWSTINSSMNGSIYNLSVWRIVSDSLNGSIYNISSWDAFNTTLNGSIWNKTSSWGVFYSTLNGSIYNTSGTWSIIDANINGSIYNTSVWSAFSTSLNGTVYNNTGVWTVVNNSMNGSLYNLTSWNVFNNTINGSVYNISNWHITNNTYNGSLYNISAWHITNNTINGTIYNASTYGWGPINTTLNGSVWNQTPSWTILISDLNGSIYNITSWITINNSINGTIYNQTTTWNTINNTINGSIYNLSNWMIIDASLNGSIYNISDWSIINNTINGSVYNTSNWDIINNTINGSIYNLSTYGWSPIIIDINGTIYNTSQWTIINNTLNGTIYNLSIFMEIYTTINGTIYNTTSFISFNNTINGSVYNQTRWNTINNSINGTIFNISAWVVINSSLNGSIFNITTYIIIDLSINGTIYNISAWATINNTINGTIFNLSVAIIILDIYPANESTGIPRNVTYHITVAHTQGALMNITWHRDNGSVYLGSNLNIPNGTYHMFSNASLATHRYWWWINVSAGGVWNNSTQWYETGMQMAGSTSVIGGGSNRTTLFFVLGSAFGVIGSIFMIGKRRRKKRKNIR